MLKSPDKKMESTMHRLAAAACFSALISTIPVSASAKGQTHQTREHSIVVEKMVGRLKEPWALAFLPDGDMLVTERGGRLLLIDDEKFQKNSVSGVPKVAASGQGGLLDVAVDPQFTENRTIYLSYSEPGTGGKRGTAVMRARLDAGTGRPALKDAKVIFQQQPKVSGGRHFGSRIVVARDGTLFVTLGDRGVREEAQNLKTHFGKVVRINKDGSVPGDNPFKSRSDALPEIYSFGHRNPQGATLNPATGRLWTLSHGARGGDEINRPQAGKNYGWPTISYGRHYSGGKIGIGTEAPDMEQPVHYWDPSIAPSGLTFYSGDLFPKWRGNLFAGALKDQLISRLEISEGRVTGEEQILVGDYGRIRDVRQGPDGALWFVNDKNRGGLFRILPSR